MQFSVQTATVLLAVLASAPSSLVAAGPIEERSTSLCNQKYYGASGYPWVESSTPGSFCSKTKPSNSGQWSTLPYWDGGDLVRCSGSSKKNYKVCNGGNSAVSLPQSCNPPHNFPSGWGGLKSGSSTSGVTIKCTPATCSWSTLWNCLLPSAWRQTCTVVVSGGSKTTSTTSTKAVTSSSAAASSSAAVSSAASSAAAVSSSAAGSSTASAVSSAAASSAAGSSTSSVDPNATTSSSVPVVSSSSSAAASSVDPNAGSASSTTSSAAAAATTTATVDPTQYPVCETTYQVTYTNYTIVAPNGYWMGQTVGAATQDASYMTYTLATTVDDCLAACDGIEGCVFVNTYYDENDTETDLPKHTPGVLTCAMFSQCVGTDENTNFGGQDDPNIIVNSNGYCKSGACS